MVCGRDSWRPRQRLLDAVVVVGDLQRAEIEFADVRGFETDIRGRTRGT
jgi:hypothetical protein